MEKDLDKKLYNDYLNGEKQAFEFLYNKYKSRIEYFVYNIVKDYQKAEDITQETFIYVMQNRMKENISFKYYIYMVAKSRAINYINTEKRRNELMKEYYSNNSERTEKDVLEFIEKEETRKEVLDSIELLDEKYKNAIYLVNIEGFSYGETAKILGQTLQNTKNLIHRGKKELRKILLKKGFDEMNKVSKVFVIIICTTILLSGIVYATTCIIKNVWRKPEKYNWQEESKVTQEDEEIAISEDEIAIIINEKLSWLGYENAQILDKQLVKFPESKKMEWLITLNNNTNFTLNAINGDLVQFSDSSFNDLEIKSTVNKDKAEKIARELYTKLGYKENEYDISTLTKSEIGTDEALWRVDFCKKYGDIFNKYQCIRISFVPEIERIKVLTIFDEECEDNQIIITEKEAIEIAKKRLNRDESEIKSVTTKMEFQEMNTTWYQADEKSDNENTTETTTETTNTIETSYRMPETVIRKVWTVEIDYTSSEFASINSYYIDATTGEIIGGDTTG